MLHKKIFFNLKKGAAAGSPCLSDKLESGSGSWTPAQILTPGVNPQRSGSPLEAGASSPCRNCGCWLGSGSHAKARAGNTWRVA